MRKIIIKNTTLGDVRDLISASGTMPGRRKSDILSALHIFEKVTGQSLDLIPSDVKTVRGLAGGINPSVFGLKKERWNNIRSLIFAALDSSGVPRQAGKSSTPISSAWEDLLARAPDRPYRLVLMAFGRWCSRRNLNPEQLVQATFNEYLKELEALTSRVRPRHTYLAVVRLWNTAMREIEGWPQLEVQAERHRTRLRLSWSEFPPSLGNEIAAMARANANPDPLGDNWHRPLRPATVQARANALLTFASVLVARGRPRGSLASIADLVDPHNVKLGLSYYTDRGDDGRSRSMATAFNLAGLLLSLARHWAFRSDGELSDSVSKLRNLSVEVLKKYQQNLRPKQRGMTDKNRATLRPFRDDRLIAKLVDLPEKLWRQQWIGVPPGLEQARRLQIATAVAILTCAPIRRKNLVELDLERNIVRHGRGRDARVHLYFAASEIKNEIDLEIALPNATVAILDRYLREVRPLLMQCPSPYLFPGQKGGFKTPYLLSNQIADFTMAKLGVRVTPHQFRHLAGLIFLRRNPGGHEVVRQILGHKSIETTISAYAGMETDEAFKNFDRVVSQHRSAT